MTKISAIEAEAIGIDSLTEEQRERIRQRAYELFEARGREPGFEIDDWRKAEAEISSAQPLPMKEDE